MRKKEKNRRANYPNIRATNHGTLENKERETKSYKPKTEKEIRNPYNLSILKRAKDGGKRHTSNKAPTERKSSRKSQGGTAQRRRSMEQ